MDILTFIFGSIVLLTTTWMTINRENDYKEFLEERNDLGLADVETFDFIVVGGGLAGSVVASTLSQNFTVLLLEIGGTPPPTTNVPANAAYINSHDDIAFTHNSVPHPQAGLYYGGVIPTNTGKVLGGGSTINGLVYNRGHPLDFDLWANMTRDASWSYENLLPVFRSVENYQGEFPIGDQHGTAGPLTLMSQDYQKGAEVWFEAGRELGYGIYDPNGPQRTGFSPITFNHKNGRRDSIYNAFLEPVLNRSSLTVRRYSEAHEILLNENNTRAIGVRYTRHSTQDQVAFARNEVIVSAGAFGSAKLLLKSGIGPSAHLIEAGIEPKVELPVGESLQDHSGAPILAKVNASAEPYLYFPERDLTLDSISEFENNGTGVLTYIAVYAIGLGFIPSSRAAAQGHPDWVDIQLMLNSYFPGAVYGDVSTYRLTFVVMGGRPNSRGYVRLNTTDPNGPVVWSMGMFEDPDQDDIKVHLEGVRELIRVINTDAYQRLAATIDRDIFPICQFLEYDSDEYWECYIKHMVGSGWHSVGSCPMGYGLDDPTAVVDSRLRVLGVDGLRIIDASVMPAVPNSNTQAPTLVVAKKGAEDVLATWTTQLHS